MFLYRFVRRRRAPPPPAADSCPCDNFWTTFWIYFIFGTIVCPDLQITWLDFGPFSSRLWPWIFKVKYGICYISAKNGPIVTKRKPNISIELLGSNVTIRFDLGHDLDLEFSRSNIEFAISRPKMVRLPRNEKQIYRSNSKPQLWPSYLTLAMTLTLHFQCQIWNLLYLSHKWSNCHETESKHIDWTPGLKCDQWVWPWPWPWPLNFEGQMWPWPSTTHMTLTMEFHGQILK